MGIKQISDSDWVWSCMIGLEHPWCEESQQHEHSKHSVSRHFGLTGADGESAFLFPLCEFKT